MPNLRPLYGAALTLLLLLACHFIIRKIGLGHYIANDYFSMQAAMEWECSLPTDGVFSLLPRCVTLISNQIYKTPLFYLGSILGFSFLKFFFLFKTCQTLAAKTADPRLAIYIAVFALILITVGGAGRFSLGSGNILVLSDIYTRSWAQVLLLAGLFSFVQKRFLLTSLLLGPALLLQGLNATNFAAVLGIAFLLSATHKERWRLPLFIAPFLTFFAYQYYLAYGVPSFSFSDLNPVQDEGGLTTEQWYRYIFSQDPDDLSILFHFQRGWVSVGYIVLGFFGLYLSGQVEKARSIQILLTKPGVAIMVAGYSYIVLCAALEYFSAPTFLIEKLIVLQPRRIMYLPLLMASYYLAHYTIDFLSLQDRATNRHWLTLIVVYSIFSILLALSAWKDTGVSPKLAIMYGLFLVGALTTWLYLARNRPYVISSAMKIPAAFALILIFVIGKTYPYLSAKTLPDFQTLFFTTQSRDYAGYLQTVGRLSGQEEQVRDFFDMVGVIAALPPIDRQIITVGIGQKTQKDFSVFTQKSVAGFDPFTAARGGAHYQKKRLVQIAPTLSAISNLSLDQFTDLGRAKQISIFEEFARENILTSPKLITSINGRLPSYVLFSGACPDSPLGSDVIHSNSTYCLYQP